MTGAKMRYSKPQKISWVQFVSYISSILRSHSHYVTRCEWYLLQTEIPGKHSQPSKAIFQPLISGIKSLHVSSSQLCSNLNGVQLLEGINQRRWLNFTSKPSVKTESVAGVREVSKPQLYSCESQGQESTFEVLY